LVDAFKNSKPVPKSSPTTILTTLLSERFVTVTVKVTVSPMKASGLLITLVTSKSIGSGSQSGVRFGSQASKGSEPLASSSPSDIPSPSVSHNSIELSAIQGFTFAGSC